MGIPHRLFRVLFSQQYLPEALRPSAGVLTCTPKKRNFAMTFDPRN